MIEILTSAQMRSIEGAAIESGVVTGLALMERAGEGVVAAILDHWPDLAQGRARAVVLCGPGNNGGDGFVLARLLAARGWEVSVFLYGDPAHLPPDAAANCRRWCATGALHRLDMPRPTDAQLQAFKDAISPSDDIASGRGAGAGSLPPVLVDALFGIGLTRPLTGIDALVALWDPSTDAGNRHSLRRVAVDIPSGLDADSGDIVRGEGMAGSGVLPADLTVTFHARKPGHVSGSGAGFCGRVVVADIGLGPLDRQDHDA